MSSSHVVVGAALGAVVTAAVTRRRIEPPPAPTPPELAVARRDGTCTCGCLALEVQCAHWRQQFEHLRLATFGPRQPATIGILDGHNRGPAA